jgi:formate dehydrogenase beta subunit
VIVLGGGNTAMDCCRSSRRLGGTDVKVVVRSGFDEMKASPWEKEDAQHEGIPILNFHVPKALYHRNGKLLGMTFEVVKAVYDDKGKRTPGAHRRADVFLECDDVLVAVGQENAFPWIERDSGIAFDQWGLPVVDEKTFQSSLPKCFLAAMRRLAPRTSSPPWRTAMRRRCRSTGCCNGEDVKVRPSPLTNLMSQKMGIHEWSYDNDTSNDNRFKVPWAKAEHCTGEHQGGGGVGL